ncbi:MAG: hypothetical protein KDK99_06830 [Verrucomicrobiales bacterium]|nr:hypothetical protein [Verrucomicrobiales bacterium]
MNSLHWGIRSLILASLLAGSTAIAGEIQDDYTLTLPVKKLAEDGLRLYQAGTFSGSYGGGHYTDPDPETRVSDFWSDGNVCKLDRDNNGHHETIFLLKKGKLEYVGSIGRSGNWVDTAIKYNKYKKSSLGYFLNAIR